MNAGSSNSGKALAVIGALFFLGPAVGAIGTVVGMMRAFGILERSGVADPRQLSAAIGDVLIVLTAGLGFGLAGLILICIALFGVRYRAKWLFWFLGIYGGFSLVCVLVGVLGFWFTRFLAPAGP